jgi:multidrug resistance efflux pump
MEKLPPIPTPFRTRWREFRYQYVPLITFAGIVAIVVTMWRAYVVPPNVLAEAEPISVRLVTAEPGMLVQLNVERYQRVTNGQPLCVVETMDTNALRAELAVVEGDLRLMRSRMSLDQTRNEQNYLRELLVAQSERAQLETDRVNMKKAEADFLRISNLFHATPALESEANYDLARYTFFGLCTNVAVTEVRLAEKERILPLLRGTNNTAMSEAVDNDVQVQVEQLRAAQRTTLRSPLDGTISAISNRVGEMVLGGRPILVITANESTNILAYARQPLNTTPRIGDNVLVRKQTFRRQVGLAKVIQVGSQLEPIDRPLLGGGAAGVRYGYDLGLPFLITVPKGLELAPGERVDVVLNPSQKVLARF